MSSALNYFTYADELSYSGCVLKVLGVCSFVFLAF